MLRNFGFVDEERMINEFAEVLEGLEDVLRFRIARRATNFSLDSVSDLRCREIVVKLFLKGREFDIVVLNDLRREVVENVFFESTKEEREDLLV